MHLEWQRRRMRSIGSKAPGGLQRSWYVREQDAALETV